MSPSWPSKPCQSATSCHPRSQKSPPTSPVTLNACEYRNTHTHTHTHTSTNAKVTASIVDVYTPLGFSNLRGSWISEHINTASWFVALLCFGNAHYLLIHSPFWFATLQKTSLFKALCEIIPSVQICQKQENNKNNVLRPIFSSTLSFLMACCEFDGGSLLVSFFSIVWIVVVGYCCISYTDFCCRTRC